MKALIVEDDPENALFVSKGLFGIGFTSRIVGDGVAALKAIKAHAYDIAIVDIQLPKMSGFELIRQLREANNPIPVLILSSLNQAADRISGLNIGADDYLTKPFALNELTARVNAILRRTQAVEPRRTLTVGELKLDASTEKAYRNGRLLDLTHKEFELLFYLASNATHTVTVNMILQTVWKCDSSPLTTVVESMLCKLRRKLSVRGESELIHTVRGFGYVLR